MGQQEGGKFGQEPKEVMPGYIVLALFVQRHLFNP